MEIERNNSEMGKQLKSAKKVLYNLLKLENRKCHFNVAFHAKFSIICVDNKNRLKRIVAKTILPKGLSELAVH